LHRGAAYVEDAPDGGARFVVELPTFTVAAVDASSPRSLRRDRVREPAPEPGIARRTSRGARWRSKRDPDSARRP